MFSTFKLSRFLYTSTLLHGQNLTMQLSDRLRATSFQKARWSFRSQELRKERIGYDIPPVIDLNEAVLQQLHLC